MAVLISTHAQVLRSYSQALPIHAKTARERGTVELPGEPPTVLAANLPYNVAVPVVLRLLAALPSVERGVVMVQAEVADRMCAGPGSRVYGIPSAKLAWYADAKPAGTVPRGVFWPVPNVDSKLVAFTRAKNLGVAGQDLFDQRGAGARHADDKDRHRRPIAGAGLLAQ